MVVVVLGWKDKGRLGSSVALDEGGGVITAVDDLRRFPPPKEKDNFLIECLSLSIMVVDSVVDN